MTHTNHSVCGGGNIIPDVPFKFGRKEVVFFLRNKLTAAEHRGKNQIVTMDPRYGSPRAIDAVDPAIPSYDSWPTLPSTRVEKRSPCSPCCRRRLTWSSVSVLEMVLMILTVVYCFFLPKKYLEHILPEDSGKGASQITELSQWTLRMFGSMVCVQVSKLDELASLSHHTIIPFNKQI